MQEQAPTKPKRKQHIIRPEDINRQGGRLPIQQGNLEKVELERLLGRMLKSKRTPVQYKSAMASSLSILKGWNKYTDDTKAIDISNYLHRWAAERVYTIGAKHICADELLHSEAPAMQAACQAASEGGIPNGEADGIELSPLQIIPAIKNSAIIAVNNEVITQGGPDGAGLPGERDSDRPRGEDSKRVDDTQGSGAAAGAPWVDEG